ncbi:MAG: riboflavin synthase [Brevinema sp.]
MFTGIIESVGTITKLHRNPRGFEISIKPKNEDFLNDCKLGDSISINGICLTITHMDNLHFTVDVMAETLRVTTLQHLSSSDNVNLEKALQLSTRLGGHIVSGHVDGVGKILSVTQEGISVWIKIEAPASILKYILPRGSICIDGISLTAARVHSSSFEVSIIPHTASETTLLTKKVGDFVNIESDVIAKYVERLTGQSDSNNKISIEFLEKNGF